MLTLDFLPRQIATHTSHLSTLSNLLLTFLPAHLLPHLPPPCAPHGYPSSNTPASAIARRQMFDYPPSRHPGQGSTSRMQGALGLVREHWDLTRSRERLPGTGSSKKRSGMLGGSGTGDEREEKKKSTNSDPLLRHPNQHTKKRIQAAQAAAAAAAAAAGGGGSGHIHMGGGGGAVPATATNLAAGVYATVGVTHHNHPMGMTAVEAVKAKRSNGGAEQYGGSSQGSVVGQPGSVASRIAGGVPGVGQVGGNAGGLVYHAVQDDYGMNRMSSKRKVEDSSAARKRTKKGCVRPVLFTPVFKVADDFTSSSCTFSVPSTRPTLRHEPSPLAPPPSLLPLFSTPRNLLVVPLPRRTPTT